MLSESTQHALKVIVVLFGILEIALILYLHHRTAKLRHRKNPSGRRRAAPDYATWQTAFYNALRPDTAPEAAEAYANKVFAITTAAYSRIAKEQQQ